MQYPVNFTFKIMAIAPQIMVTDASGTMRYYVKQKLFKLKEAVNVFRDKSQSEKLFSIQADRILDFNAKYQITGTDGAEVGSLRRQGMKSIWRTHYDIYDGETHALTIREENPWKRVLEAVHSDIPVIGFIAVLLLNPAYIISRTDGTKLFKLTKKPAFFEGKFELTQLGQSTDDEERKSLLSLMMMMLLERSRG